jgi:monovalent cation:proton antiporter-2 (CPA2) family protein
MISHYLADIITLLLAAVIAVPIFQAIRLGAVPGFLVSGVIVGPSGLGLIKNVSEVGYLAEIGVVLLLFVIGIELKPSRLWLMRRLVFGLGSLQVILSGIFLGCIGHYLFDISLRAAILIGPALALSSTAFVLQLLTEQKLLTSTYGRTSFSVLLLQDLAVVPLLALVPLLVMPELSFGKDIGFALAESILILCLIVLIGRYLLHPVLHRVALSGNAEVFTASAVLVVLGTALVTEHIGLSMAMGAFIAGLFISDSSYRHQVLAEVEPFRGLLLGLFFMSMGMSLNLNLLLENPLVSFGLVGVLIMVKVVVLFPLAYLFGIKTKSSLAVALVLAQSGEFALVLFSLAYDAEIFTEKLFQHLLLIVLLSMLITPVLAHVAQRLSKAKDKKTIDNIDIPVAPVVLAGFGRVGHRIGEIFSIAEIPFVAMDLDASVVEKERKKGHPVFYGDVCNPKLIKAAGASHAKVIIVTLDDFDATEKLVLTLRKIYPKVHVYVRGHSLHKCAELRRLGASGVVSENIEASLELARMALATIGFDNNKRETILGDFRSTYYSQIDNAASSKNKKTSGG